MEAKRRAEQKRPTISHLRGTLEDLSGMNWHVVPEGNKASIERGTLCTAVVHALLNSSLDSQVRSCKSPVDDEAEIQDRTQPALEQDVRALLSVLQQARTN